MLSVKAKYKDGKVIFKDKINISKPLDVIVTFLDKEDEQNMELSKTGKELLKRKIELDSGKVKPITLDEVFDV